MTRGIAIIGGGPAGCSAAHALGAFGLDVVLFEAGARRRDKVCGDGLISKSVEHLARMGIHAEMLAQSGGCPYESAELVIEGPCPRRIRMPHEGGWVVPRAFLDQLMRDSIARVCRVREATFVKSIRALDDGSVKLTFGDGRPAETYGALVIASGATSRLARGFMLDGRPELAISFRAYARSTGTLDFDGVSLSFSPACRDGYQWLFPLTERLVNIGICARMHDGGMSGPSLRMQLNDKLADARLDVAATRVRGGIGTLWSGAGKAWHHASGIVSCGDAAGLVDPLTGEGISGALVSGALAGECIGRFMRDGRDVTHLTEYSRRVQCYFEERYQLNAVRSVFSDCMRASAVSLPESQPSQMKSTNAINRNGHIDTMAAR